MSGLAEILLKKLFTISGSDAKSSDLTHHLTSLGAQVFYGPKAETFFLEIDLPIVYTAAIHPDARNLPRKSCRCSDADRAELLGQIMRNY